MAKDPHSHEYVDHFLQADIISKLALAERPMRFTDLKDDGIENSLFMYHANKLITRGLVEKSAEGFVITTRGARWVNYSGVLHDFSIKGLTKALSDGYDWRETAKGRLPGELAPEGDFTHSALEDAAYQQKIYFALAARLEVGLQLCRLKVVFHPFGIISMNTHSCKRSDRTNMGVGDSTLML